jgi:hypothetical protein
MTASDFLPDGWELERLVVSSDPAHMLFATAEVGGRDHGRREGAEDVIPLLHPFKKPSTQNKHLGGIYETI